MREIKFRAWDEDKKQLTPIKMLEWSASLHSFQAMDVDDEISSRTPVSDKKLNNMIVEQYIGVKDDRGFEIYEGDIVQKVWFTEMPDGSIDTTKIGDPFKVKVGNYAYGKWIAEEILNQGFGVTNYVMADELIILGNIHENPELLEGE